MFNKFSNAVRNFEDNFSLSKATFIIATATLLTKLVSLLRVNIFASRFAATDLADVYFSSFRIPDFIFNLLILGTISVAFIPLYVQFRNKDKDEAIEFANNILSTAFLGMLVVALIAFIFLGPLTRSLLPGFSEEKLKMTIEFSRILLISPLIFTISNVVSSILASHRRFLWVSLAPTFYNFGIIVGILFLYPIFNFYGLAYGVILGAMLHLLVQIPELFKTGFRLRINLSWHNRHFKSFIKLFVPRILAFDSSNVSLIIGSIIGSSLAVGSISVYSYAFDLQSVPLGVFAFSTAAAAFPVLTSAYARDDLTEYVSTLSRVVVKILFYIVPFSLALLVFRAQIVRILLGHGQFGWNETILTFDSLGIFSLSLSAQALVPLLSRAFYARHDTTTPVILGVFSMLINAGLAYLLHFRYGIAGVVSAFSIASVVNCLLLFGLLRFYKMRHVPKKLIEQEFDSYLAVNIVKLVSASAVMGLAFYGMLYLLAEFIVTDLTIGLMAQVGISALVGGLIYLFLTYKFKLQEAEGIIVMIIRVFKRCFNRGLSVK